MKKTGLVFVLMFVLIMTSISAVATEEYIIAQDDFSSGTINTEMWNTGVNFGEFGEIAIKEDPDNQENKCLSVDVLAPANGVTLSEAVLKNSYAPYFTATFKMKLYTGDNNQLTEYAGIYIHYKNDGDFLALQWSRRFDGDNAKIALVKNGYEKENAITINSASGFQADWDPYAWTDFKVVCAGTKVLVYVNGADEPCITYNENTHTDGKLGFFNRGMYAKNSCLYVDDIVIESEASAVAGATVVCGEESYTCSESTVIGSRFVDSVNVNFTREIKNAEVKLTDEDKNEIACEKTLNESGTQLVIVPKGKLANAKKYFVNFESLTTSDDKVLLSVAPVSFKSAKNVIKITPTLAGQTLSVAIEKETDISNVYIYAAHYKNGVLVELICTPVPAAGNPEDVAFSKSIDETSDVKIYSFGGEKFEKIITEPVNCIG